MRKLLFLFFFVVCCCSACRPVYTTKQYYNKYVLPKASVDYEEVESTDLPARLLDDFYSVDSDIVRLGNQIELFASLAEDSWISQTKEKNPWVKSVEVLDQDLFFVFGDDTLGHEPRLRDILASMEKTEQRKAIDFDGRTFFIYVQSVNYEQYRIILLEVSLDQLLRDVANDNFCLAISGVPVWGDAAEGMDKALAKADSSKKYSGKLRGGDRRIYWIKSMGCDNFVYLFAD